MTRLLLVLALFSCSITPKPVAVPVAASVDVPVSGELAVRRGRLISWLHDYRVAGVFPSDAAGLPISVFMDARGVRCPMAEMIHLSGRDDLVLAVRRENNSVRLAEVHSGPLFDWMLASGLTQEEVALVQGALTLDEQFRFQGEAIQVQTADATVRGKLEMAEAALRTATPASLVTATRRLPNVPVATLASTPIAGGAVLASR